MGDITPLRVKTHVRGQPLVMRLELGLQIIYSCSGTPRIQMYQRMRESIKSPLQTCRKHHLEPVGRILIPNLEKD